MKLSEERLKKNGELEEILRVNFSDKNLLNQALSHSSSKMPHNERLEFFGDAVLKLAISQYLFEKFPDYSEGDLTKIRAVVVSDASLAQIAREISLGQFLLLGKSERRTKEFNRASILASALEAIFGAIYLDQGLLIAGETILRLLASKINQALSKNAIIDFKSALQEEVQKRTWPLPAYLVVKEKGPQHQKTFYVEVKVGEGSLLIKGQGRGTTKKTAEQFAARQAFEKLTTSKTSEF